MKVEDCLEPGRLARPSAIRRDLDRDRRMRFAPLGASGRGFLVAKLGLKVGVEAVDLCEEKWHGDRRLSHWQCVWEPDR